jgi:Tfp pilus assembly protein PilF
LFVLSFICPCLPVESQAKPHAQSPQESISEETARAVKLYQRGDAQTAIHILRDAVKQDKDDAVAWYYLGVVLSNNNNANEARQAFEKALKLRPGFAAARVGLANLWLGADKLSDAMHEAGLVLASEARNAEAHYIIGLVLLRQLDFSKALEKADAALQINPDFSPALLLKAEAFTYIYGQVSYEAAQALTHNKTLLEELKKMSPEARSQRRQKLVAPLLPAVESLERYLTLNANSSDSVYWRDRLETLRFYIDLVDEDDSNRSVFHGYETTTSARISFRPKAEITEAARQGKLHGKVVMKAVFAADGTVKHIIVLHPLKYGMTEQSVIAARGIKFTPATKDGRPVSQYILISMGLVPRKLAALDWMSEQVHP